MARLKPGRIRAEFGAYDRFLKDRKTVEHRQIKMSEGGQKGSKRNFHGKTAVNYAPVQGDKSLEAEVSITDFGHYHLRLFANWFDDGPCLRFDSKGLAHCNPENGQGLRKRQVLTPHFHRFLNEENVEIAYQTAKLRGVDSNLIVSHYRHGLEHFCQEASLTCNDSPTVHPELIIEQAGLDLSSDDPQNGVSF